MGKEAVVAFLQRVAPEAEILDLDRPSETRWLSAELGIHPAQIAKSLVISVAGAPAMLMACGDSKLDNAKAKAAFGAKVRFIPTGDAASLTGHVPGGVCPFGIPESLPIYCDVMLKSYDVVVTGGGIPECAVRISPHRLAEVTKATWVDVCIASVTPAAGH